MATQEAHQTPQEARQQAFGYACRACSRCCQDKIIQVNPYEVARLARNRGITTTAFRAQYTDQGAGIHLSRTEDTNTCVFLGPQGCTVHPDRPLVCRLYPLGRRVIEGGKELWVQVTPHPQSAGEYHDRGTIAGYLAAQGAEPFMQAADAYAQWVRDACTFLEAGGEAWTIDPTDLDATISAHCANTGVVEPSDTEARRRLHMEILTRLIQPTGGNDENSDDR